MEKENTLDVGISRNLQIDSSVCFVAVAVNPRIQETYTSIIWKKRREMIPSE
jgi:hypothetical protein